ELLCAARGVEFRAPLQTSPVLQQVLTRLRQDVTRLEEDRYMAPDLETAKALVADGALLDGLTAELPELA
ncbi:MAG: histidine ammonia-lyase, partial [Pseudomonadota bacterium]|nr:histidine ammonia-lyase [Pseudomonadota bacterium]